VDLTPFAEVPVFADSPARIAKINQGPANSALIELTGRASGGANRFLQFYSSSSSPLLFKIKNDHKPLVPDSLSKGERILATV
jgi:hypothetical protein